MLLCYRSEPGGLPLLRALQVYRIHFHLGDSNAFVIPEWLAAACPECLFPAQRFSVLKGASSPSPVEVDALECNLIIPKQVFTAEC